MSGIRTLRRRMVAQQLIDADRRDRRRLDRVSRGLAVAKGGPMTRMIVYAPIGAPSDRWPAFLGHPTKNRPTVVAPPRKEPAAEAA